MDQRKKRADYVLKEVTYGSWNMYSEIRDGIHQIVIRTYQDFVTYVKNLLN
jgi:hypothetical protein